MPTELTLLTDITVEKLTNDDLTTKVVGGTGIFDVLMTSVKAHIKEEHIAGRITGDQYTKAYIELTSAAISGGIQFLMGRDTAFWQAHLIRNQAINADVQRQLILEQVETARAQTLDTRTDGTTPVTGVLGKQKDLYNQQITSYQRDAEVKAAKLFTDAWITQKTLDEGLVAPNGFTNSSVDLVLTKIKTENGFI